MPEDVAARAHEPVAGNPRANRSRVPAGRDEIRILDNLLSRS